MQTQETPKMRDKEKETTKDSKKIRYKLTQACDMCRQKRMKCDGQYPRCTPCNKKEYSCTYDLATRRRGPKVKRAEVLEERIKELEALLTLKNQSKGFEGQLEIKESSSANNNNKEGYDNRDGLYLLTNSQPDYTLPSEEVIEELINLFFSITHPTIRFIHKPTLMSRLLSDNKPYLLLNGMFALSSRFSKHPEVSKINQPRYLNGEVFAKRLLSLLNPSLLSQPTLDTIQALILLGLYSYGAMKGFSSWNYIGIAIRLAQQLGLNMMDSYHHKDSIPRLSDEDWLITECKRRTWWGCFIADRFAASLVGRSLYIDERDCLVQLPSSDPRWDTRFSIISQLPPTTLDELYDFASDLSGNKSVFCDLSSHFINLINLSGKVTRYLLHKASRGIPYDYDYNELIQLDNELLNWAKELPTRFHRPQNFLPPSSSSSNVINPNNTADNNSSNNIKDIFLAVSCMFAMYHGTVITLHRGNLAHAQTDQNGIEVVKLSKNRCILAANQISGLLRDAWHHLNDIADPYFPYFVFNASTIHANVIYLEDEPNQLMKSKEFLRLCTNTLKNLSDIWLMSKIYLEMLETLITTLSYEQESLQSNQINQVYYKNSTPHPSPRLFPNNHNQHHSLVPPHPTNDHHPLVPPHPTPGGYPAIHTPYTSQPIKSSIWEVFSISYFDWFYSISSNQPNQQNTNSSSEKR